MADDHFEQDAGLSARAMLLEIHRAIGRTEGTVSSLGLRVDQHIRDEQGLMGKVDALSCSATERHESLHVSIHAPVRGRLGEKRPG